MPVWPSTMTANGTNFPEQVLRKILVDFLLIAGPLIAMVLYLNKAAVGRTTLVQVAAGAVTAVVSVATFALQFPACRNWVSICLIRPSRMQSVFFYVISFVVGASHACYALPVFLDPLARDTLELFFPVSLFVMLYATSVTARFLPFEVFSCALAILATFTLYAEHAEGQDLMEAMRSLLPNAVVFLVLTATLTLRISLLSHRRHHGGSNSPSLDGAPDEVQPHAHVSFTGILPPTSGEVHRDGGLAALDSPGCRDNTVVDVGDSSFIPNIGTTSDVHPADDGPSGLVEPCEHILIGTVSEMLEESCDIPSVREDHVQAEQYRRVHAWSSEVSGRLDHTESELSVERDMCDDVVSQVDVTSDAGSKSTSSSNAPTLLGALSLALEHLLPASIIGDLWSRAGSRTSTTAVCEKTPDSEVWASVASLPRPELHRVSTPAGRDRTPELYLSDSPDLFLAELQENIGQTRRFQMPRPRQHALR
ncbi:unnamed protein product [Prorocentrum cordatum]|uniref:Uncharacterized protein n=1 Tax=Prorocentrum cordatum TaxID=2364126 RepID=A0ABN9XR36_9DINO|nr:unnamed protein product [Polarella glacialis]